VLWPFIWIWATLYREDRGWGFADQRSSKEYIDRLEARIDQLATEVKQLQAAQPSSPTAAKQSNNQSTVGGE
jgi:hypothetical protein